LPDFSFEKSIHLIYLFQICTKEPDRLSQYPHLTAGKIPIWEVASAHNLERRLGRIGESRGILGKARWVEAHAAAVRAVASDLPERPYCCDETKMQLATSFLLYSVRQRTGFAADSLLFILVAAMNHPFGRAASRPTASVRFSGGI
jgi:hypothetical protein